MYFVVHPESGWTWCGPVRPSATSWSRTRRGNGISAMWLPCTCPIARPSTRNSVSPNSPESVVIPGQLVTSPTIRCPRDGTLVEASFRVMSGRTPRSAAPFLFPRTLSAHARRRGPVVEGRRPLPDLPPFLCRLERRWRRGPARDRRPPRAPLLARHRRHLAEPDHCLPRRR